MLGKCLEYIGEIERYYYMY